MGAREQVESRRERVSAEALSQSNGTQGMEEEQGTMKEHVTCWGGEKAGAVRSSALKKESAYFIGKKLEHDLWMNERMNEW